MLFGKRKESFSRWLNQAQVFYANLQNDADLMNTLSQFGYTSQKLKQESDFLKKVRFQSQQQKKEIGEAQATTQARNKKIEELAKWISDFKAVAKVALEQNPQQLEKLGILVRTKV